MTSTFIIIMMMIFIYNPYVDVVMPLSLEFYILKNDWFPVSLKVRKTPKIQVDYDVPERLMKSNFVRLK